MNAILPAQLSATTCSGHARRDTVTMHLCHPGDASVGVPGDACTVQLDVDSYWQMIVKGSILVLAVWVDVSTRSGRR